MGNLIKQINTLISEDEFVLNVMYNHIINCIDPKDVKAFKKTYEDAMKKRNESVSSIQKQLIEKRNLL